MCEHFYDFGRFWICFDCKIIGVRIGNRDFEIEFSRKHLIRIKQYPIWKIKEPCELSKIVISIKTS